MHSKHRNLKVISWNIAEGHTFSGTVQDAFTYDELDLNYFSEQLVLTKPDIVGLQEACTPVSADAAGSQPKKIAKRLNISAVESFPYGKSHIKKNYYNTSLAVLSKFPIKKSYFHKLSNPNLTVVHPNKVVWKSFDVGISISEIDFFGTIINVANCHLTPFHYFKKNFVEPEFKHIRDDISYVLRGLLDKPTVAIGDFNYHDLSELLPAILSNRNRYFTEAFVDVETAPGKGQQDHILFSKDWRLKNYEVKQLQADHYLCSAILELL